MSPTVAIILLPVLVALVWFMLVMLSPRQKRTCHYLMAITLLVWGCDMAVLGICCANSGNTLFIYDYVFKVLSLFGSAMGYITVCSITEPQGVSLAQRRTFGVAVLYTLALTYGAFALGPRQYDAMCHQIRTTALSLQPNHTAYNAMLIIDNYAYIALSLAYNVVLLVIIWYKYRQYTVRYNSFYASALGTAPLKTAALVVPMWAIFVLQSLLTWLIYSPATAQMGVVSVCSVLIAAMVFPLGLYIWRLRYDARSLATHINNTHNA